MMSSIGIGEKTSTYIIKTAANIALRCRYFSLASKSCNEVFYRQVSTVFKLFRHRVNASSNFATVTFFIVFKMCRHRVNAVLNRKLYLFAEAIAYVIHKIV